MTKKKLFNGKKTRKKFLVRPPTSCCTLHPTFVEKTFPQEKKMIHRAEMKTRKTKTDHQADPEFLDVVLVTPKIQFAKSNCLA
jgi:hypothetical protein